MIGRAAHQPVRALQQPERERAVQAAGQEEYPEPAGEEEGKGEEGGEDEESHEGRGHVDASASTATSFWHHLSEDRKNLDL